MISVTPNMCKLYLMCVQITYHTKKIFRYDYLLDKLKNFSDIVIGTSPLFNPPKTTSHVLCGRGLHAFLPLLVGASVVQVSDPLPNSSVR